jgi:hypothetical protein
MPDPALDNAIAQVSKAQKGVPIIRAFSTSQLSR